MKRRFYCLILTFILPFFGLQYCWANDVVDSALDRFEANIERCASSPEVSAQERDFCIRQFSQGVPDQDVVWDETSYYDERSANDPRFNAISKELDVVEGYRVDRQYRADSPTNVQTGMSANTAEQDLSGHMEPFGSEKDQEIIQKVETGEDYIKDGKELEMRRSKISAEVGGEVSYIKYKEPNLMRNVGYYYGINGALTSRLSPENPGWDPFEEPASRTGTTMLRLEGNLSWGEVDYNSNGTGEQSGIKDWMTEIRGLAGVDYEVSPTVLLTPYFGLGYRYLNDDSGGEVTSSGARGYERESNYYYSPVGGELTLMLEDGWSLGIVQEYDIFWYGRQVSHLGDAIAGLDTVKNDQKDGYGYRASLKLQHTGEKVDVILEPFYRFWKIEDSEISSITYNGVAVGYGLEPENYTKQFGLKMAMKF